MSINDLFWGNGASADAAQICPKCAVPRPAILYGKGILVVGTFMCSQLDAPVRLGFVPSLIKAEQKMYE